MSFDIQVSSPESAVALLSALITSRRCPAKVIVAGRFWLVRAIAERLYESQIDNTAFISRNVGDVTLTTHQTQFVFRPVGTERLRTFQDEIVVLVEDTPEAVDPYEELQNRLEKYTKELVAKELVNYTRSLVRVATPHTPTGP